MTSQASNPKVKGYFNNGAGTFGAAETIAAKASHAMRPVKVGARQGLFGADYNDRPNSSIDLWLITP